MQEINQIRAILVDDQNSNLTALSFILEKLKEIFSIEISKCTSGQEAV